MQLRNEILIRDNYVCQWCNNKFLARKLNVHHIDLNRKNNDNGNLITLCKKCHVKFHTLDRWEKNWKKLKCAFSWNKYFNDNLDLMEERLEPDKIKEIRLKANKTI